MAEHLDPHLETVLKLAFVAEFRDADTSHHLRRVSLLAKCLADRLGLPDETVEAIEKAAPMHDIGKVGIPDEILFKPGSLTPDEREVMQQHTALGARLLTESVSPALRIGEEICRTHHERWDGSGYPAGLAGESIPLVGRIIGLVDVYDALVTKRVYKPAMDPAEARETLRAESGHHFDPRVVDAFFASLDAIAAIYAEYGDEDEEGGWVT